MPPAGSAAARHLTVAPAPPVGSAFPGCAWPPAKTAPGSLAFFARAYGRSLLSKNRSPNTVLNYMGAIRLLEAQMISDGDEPTPANIRQDHIESLLWGILGRRDEDGQELPGSAGTAINRYKALNAFCNWLVDPEEELDLSPMRKMKEGAATAPPVPVLPMATIEALLKACEGPKFADRRDFAIVRLFAETGIRRDELLSMGLLDLDLDANVVMVTGKGRRTRAVPFGERTSKALRKYLAVRAAHPRHAHERWLWIGRDGVLTEGGIRSLLARRCRLARVSHIYPHQFRHTFAHLYRLDGGDDDSLMRLAGWKSREMLNRYGASAGDERAIAEARRVDLGNRF